MLRFLTGGESHGCALYAIIEGMPYGLEINTSDVNQDLLHRQSAYGRGERMKIENDTITIKSGLYNGKTTGAPIVLEILNQDHTFLNNMQANPINFPRPGHADLAGALKYGTNDIRIISERAGARETAIRTAIGSIAKQFLSHFGFYFISFVTQIGAVSISVQIENTNKALKNTIYELDDAIKKSPVRCPEPLAAKNMMAAIDKVKEEGDSLGGIFLVVVTGIPPGIGSHVHWDRKLDARIAQAVLSIPAVKGVEIGIGFKGSSYSGSSFHDEIGHDGGELLRFSNNAGGIEGGISNGEPIWLRGAVKPVPSIKKPTRSINLETKEAHPSHYQRSDTCVVPACGIVAETVTAWVLAQAFMEKFGGDSMDEIKHHFNYFQDSLKR